MGGFRASALTPFQRGERGADGPNGADGANGRRGWIRGEGGGEKWGQWEEDGTGREVGAKARERGGGERWGRKRGRGMRREGGEERGWGLAGF
ncbi:hypothetical protein EEL51_09120 [Muribaculaceae bacterium Isolate-110 (HZI)]|nr:hypothetical protein EEL51_09120 [Muribaculaceae bacterium Isolate-110 (HZI)]